MTNKQIKTRLIYEELSIKRLAELVGTTRESASRAISGDNRYRLIRARIIDYLTNRRSKAA